MQDKTRPSLPKIAIVGKGAIGSLLAFKSDLLRLDFQLLLKTPQDFSLRVEDITGKQYLMTPKCSLISQPKPFDILILPVKAYQVLPALKQLQNTLCHQQTIVLLHNGLGTLERVIDMFPNNPLIAATTSYAAFKSDANTVLETGLGQTHLGWLTPCDEDAKQSIESVLSRVLPPSTWHSDINLALWEKLAMNAVINPLTAIHQIKNGQLSDPHYKGRIFEICTEITKVMIAAGYSTDTNELISKVMQVIDATANNYSSMHQDIAFNRQSEIEFINGYVVKMAGKFNLSVPLNQQLVEKIKKIECHKKTTLI